MGKKGYSQSKASRELGIDRHTLANWVNKGWVNAVRLPSGHFRISEEELNAWKRKISGEDSP